MILVLVSTVFPASGSWNVPSPPSENPQLLLRRFVPDPLLRGGSSASSLLCSSVALEAALDGVSSVFATRVQLRSWYGIAVRFEMRKLEPRECVERAVIRWTRWQVRTRRGGSYL